MLTIYKASAGSGKTYTLAFQYIKILLAYYDRMERPSLLAEEEGPQYNGDQNSEAEPQGRWRLYGPQGPRSRHRNILAVTFTHKATEEMKNRIIKELRQIVSTADAEPAQRSDYANKLLELTGCTPKELKDTAQKALDDLLYDFHFFNVSTIDSFFQQVLRGFAREVAKNEDFALEIDNTVAVTMGVDSMLNSINTDPEEQTKELSDFIEEWMESEYSAGRIGNMFNRNANIYKSLVGFVASTMSEEFKEHSEKVINYLKDDPKRFARFRKAVFDRFNAIPEQAARLAAEALAILDSSEKAVQDNFSSTPKKSLQKIAAPVIGNSSGNSSDGFAWEKDTWIKDPPEYVKNAFVDPIKLFKKDYQRKATEAPQPLCDAVAKTFEAVISGIKELKWLKAVKGLLSHFGVLVSALEFIMQYRQDNNLILLSDTNELLQKVIDDNDAPFIYEKLGNILDYYLIDEFQDTSRLQWVNLRPLVENSIAQDKENLIIGDEKQSIYRFRNADAELLHFRAQEDIGEGNYTVRGDHPGENTNYRSAPAIVRFNNSLFSLLGKKVDTPYFNNVVQDIPQKNRNKRGHIRFDVIPASKKEDFTSLVLPRLVSDIRSLRQRGYSNGNIVILVRTRDQGNVVVDYLLQQNDPDIVVASDESLLLSMCPSVRVIISTLRMFAQHREAAAEDQYDSDLEMRINEVEFINSHESDISKAVMNVVAKKTEDLKKLDEVIKYRSSNLFTLTERIIQDILTPEMRHKDYSYIMAFQDYVTKFCSQFTSNVRKFLRWWDMNEKNLTVAASPNVEAIRVMTIHKSKGLEFRCVLMPFTDVGVKANEELWLKGDRLIGVPTLQVAEEDIPPLLRVQASSGLNFEECPFYEDYKQWRKNQKTDMLNVGYVAFTRAENELIGYIKGKPAKKSDSSTKSKKSKTASEEDGSSDSNPDVTDIGKLLVEAFQGSNSQTANEVGDNADAQDNSHTDSDADSNSDNDELYYCRNRQQPIPLTMPLSPYYRQVTFEDENAYLTEGLKGIEPEENSASIDDVLDNALDNAIGNTLDADIAADADADIEVSGVNGCDDFAGTDENSGESEDMSLIIERFEYGEPTSYPAEVFTEEEEDEQQHSRELALLEKKCKEEERFRSPLLSVSISEYTPTFPKNVEHYFTVDEDEDTYEETDLSCDVADSPSEDEGLPGGFDHQMWGEILHRAMSYIHDKVETEKAIARVSRQFQMDDDAYEYLCRRVWETVEYDHPRVRMWFDRRHYDSVVTERPIYEPTTLATYRPDRIVWYKDGSADIVDYKFGTMASNEYDLQMKKYIELIRYMGVPNVRGFIYFATSKNIKEIH